MIKNVEFKTPSNEVLQETNLARLYDDMSEKIVKESEDFEGRDSGWTLDEIFRLEVRTNRYSPFRGSSSFIEVPKQIAETKAIINVINKKGLSVFHVVYSRSSLPQHQQPQQNFKLCPHLNKLNFDGISFPTPLNELSNCLENIEKGVRGGISQCCNRYAIANNRYMSNFNPDDEIKYLMYLDANNLYGYAMSKYLPLKDFVWSDNDLTEQDILNLSDESDVGYILEVDLEYPSDLHDKHSDFPLAPEKKPPPNSVEKKQFNSPPQLENQSQYRRKTTQLVSRNETTQLGNMNETTQQEKTTQLSSRNETTQLGNMNETTQQEKTTQLSSRNETTQLVSRNETTQLCTAVDRLHRLYSRIGFFYLLMISFSDI
ncbi:uncharacterized protein TNCV_3924751 [Trichonephila clavipes]|nr:uncharacterized protein TNCV_3924751 [Trichonephila clavipes]